jgi:FtsP/CotA-like multicopper oxidase with cupredoxin domain
MVPRRPPRSLPVPAAALVLAGLAAACGAAPGATPPITPGTGTTPREVNVIAREYAFVPTPVDLVPGETVLLHVINGGLETHEAVVGDGSSQVAWEAAEAAVAEHPPGPTPLVEGPPGFDGVRVVAGSGTRVDTLWSVPADAASGRAWFVGCHIPGHFSKGMVVPVRFVGIDGRPLTTGPTPSPSRT